ncbi:MAG TPA: glycoside hydrolase family 2 protein, partial [Ramlibacter sp.]
DPASTVAVFDLRADGEPASRGVVYFKAAKDMRWLDPGLRAHWRPDGNGYALELHAAALARAVWVDFGDLDADVSDNALTLLPGESVSLHVSSRARLATLRKALRVRSVVGTNPASVY